MGPALSLGSAAIAVRGASTRGARVVETGGSECGDGRVVLNAGLGLHLLCIGSLTSPCGRPPGRVEPVSEANITGQRGRLAASGGRNGNGGCALVECVEKPFVRGPRRQVFARRHVDA